MDRSYRATKTVRHDGKLYEIGKVYVLPTEIGDAVKALVPHDGVAAPAPEIVGVSQMVLIRITGGAPDAESRAILDTLLASSQPLDVRVTLDEMAARAIAGLAAPQPTIEVHGATDNPPSAETAAALEELARGAAAVLKSGDDAGAAEPEGKAKKVAKPKTRDAKE